MSEIETVVSCPAHGDLYEVLRQRVEGHFIHLIRDLASGETVSSAKTCPTCGAGLVRKDTLDG